MVGLTKDEIEYLMDRYDMRVENGFVSIKIKNSGVYNEVCAKTTSGQYLLINNDIFNLYHEQCFQPKRSPDIVVCPTCDDEIKFLLEVYRTWAERPLYPDGSSGMEEINDEESKGYVCPFCNVMIAHSYEEAIAFLNGEIILK